MQPQGALSGLQIGVGESGGLNALLAAIDVEDEAQSALAAKALASVVRSTPALQEVLLDAGGADVLIRHLNAPEMPQADAESEEKGEDRPRYRVVSASGLAWNTLVNLLVPAFDHMAAGELHSASFLVRDVLVSLLQAHENILLTGNTTAVQAQAHNRVTVLT